MTYFLRFVVAFFLVAVTAGLSSYFSYLGVDTFYPTLNLPPLNPPNHIFPLIWPILYVLMIISCTIVLNQEGNKKAMMLFIYQLVLHVLWCVLFFANAQFALALVCLVLLDITVFQMIQAFASLSKTAAYLQYPYLLWLLFATYLNAGVWYLNGANLM